MGLTRPRAAQIYDIDYKQSVRVITTTNITLTGGAPTVVDGVTLSLNDRILVTGQTTGSQNGIYIVSVVGTGSNGTWIRSTDTNATGELESGTIVMVTEGSTYADTSWKLTTNDPIVIGTTALTFEINTGNAFGTISANGTSIVSNSASGTVTFSSGNNMVITGNAGTDTITFAVQPNPTFADTVTFTGNITGNLLPSANVTYNLGSPTQRWKEIFLAANTIDIGGALISADLGTGSLILTGPDGAEFILTGTSPTTSVGQFGMIEVSNAMPAHDTTTGALTVVGGAGIGGNIHVGGIAKVAGTILGDSLSVNTSVTTTTLTTTGNASIAGNLTVSGNVISVNVTNLNVVDPIIGLGRGANNTPLTTDDGKDRGEQLWYYTTDEQSAFIGYDNSAGKLIAATNVSVTNEIVTVNNYGNMIVGGLESATISASGNANVGNLGATTVVATALTGTLTTAAQPNVTSLGTLISATVTGNVTGGNIITAGQVSATGNVTGGNINTSGKVVATGNVHGANFVATGNVELQNRSILYLNDSDNSNYIGLRSPASLVGNYVYIFPTSYGNNNQVLATNGSGGLSWVDQTGGGGGSGASQYPNSTVTPLPGSTGNFDLSYDFVQTVQEVPFETSATDPFGVNLGEVYSMMDPVGEILEGVDLGVLT